MSIESLAEDVKQFNEEFKLFPDTDFRNLLNKTDALVVKTEILVTQTRDMHERFSNIASMVSRMIRNTETIKEILWKRRS